MPETRTWRSVAAYSGGTVWALHPLRVAAGVRASTIAGSAVAARPAMAEYSRVARQRCFPVTLADRVRTWDATYRAKIEGERMSKSSTVTFREKPVEGVATAT